MKSFREYLENKNSEFKLSENKNVLDEAGKAPITWESAEDAAKDAFNILRKSGFKSTQKSKNSVRLTHKNGCVGQLVFDPHLNEEELDEAKLKPSDFKKGEMVKFASVFNSPEKDIEGKIVDFADHEDYRNGYLIIKDKKGKEYKKIFSAVEKINEAAVGEKGRTSYKEAEEYCNSNEDLINEFRKIVKKLGGKTVAKALVAKLSEKPEIKDEIEHISHMVVDNSNY